MSVICVLLHGAFQSKDSWRIPNGFKLRTMALDCSTIPKFKIESDAILNDAINTSSHLIVVSTSLGCIHGINLSVRASKLGISNIDLVLCAVPGMVFCKWQTMLLCRFLQGIRFMGYIKKPTWLSRKIWTTADHLKNLRLLSAEIPFDQRAPDCIKVHVIYSRFDPLAGSFKNQKKWVQMRIKGTPIMTTSMITHYPYIFDKNRFWSYIDRLMVGDI